MIQNQDCVTNIIPHSQHTLSQCLIVNSPQEYEGIIPHGSTVSKRSNSIKLNEVNHRSVTSESSDAHFRRFEMISSGWSVLTLSELESDHINELIQKNSFAYLMLSAIGVVFGDIGTSPLYALKECFDPDHGIAYSKEAVLGVVSMMIWSIILLVTCKYVFLVMRADNKGEGGILSLMSLALKSFDKDSKTYFFLMLLGMLGACMLLGESIITPAISVLSAVEGVDLATPGLHAGIVPVSLFILLVLFMIQRFGTATVGNIFGPITLVWFVTITILGAYNIRLAPEIADALSPAYAVMFVVQTPAIAYNVMGSVVLCVTGVEALYLDMGHFGRNPVRLSWLLVVLPSLVVNYLGQGALLLSDVRAAENPFYHMVPEWALWPVVVLATLATVIASQAVISGAYSLVSQAVSLGFLPRMTIIHTSDSERGQIYVPLVNWVLLVMVVITLVVFRNSDNLAAAYGISVTSTMLLTTTLLGFVMFHEWKFHIAFVIGIISFLFLLELAFWTANLTKIANGGWFPLLLGLVLFTSILTWHKGRILMRKKLLDGAMPIVSFVSNLSTQQHIRVDGTAVFLVTHADFVPTAMVHNLRHNGIVHRRLIFVKLSVRDVPCMKDDQRITWKDMGNSIYYIQAAHGFKENADINLILQLFLNESGIKVDAENVSFFVSRDTVVPSGTPGMALWRESLFGCMVQNSAAVSDTCRIPPNRLVTLGSKVEI